MTDSSPINDPTGDAPIEPGPEHAEPFHSGWVALIGRPNAGKSTLLNQVLGEKVSIISAKPQTTRNRVVGIHNAPGVQAVLIDTPGLHKATSRLNQGMVRLAESSLGEVDVICWVVDAQRAARDAEKGVPVLRGAVDHIAHLVAQHAGLPLTIALNKVDIVPRAWLLPVIAAFAERFPDAEIVPLSAIKGDGVDRLVAAWSARLPEGPAVFPQDQLMDASEKFVVSELIREKIFQMTQKEIPYSTAVQVESFDEEQREGGDPRVVIFARIIVERDSQKGIIIGKGGAMLKRIGTEARKDIQRLLAARVHLDLHVSVAKDWTRNPRVLRELGIE